MGTTRTGSAGTSAAAAVDPLELERQVCFALSVASRTVLTVYRPLLEPMGLTHPQYLVMLALWQHAPMSVKDVGDLLQLDSGTLSPLLKRLESSGLVTRSRDPQDERALTVALTGARPGPAPSGRAYPGAGRRAARHRHRRARGPAPGLDPGHRRSRHRDGAVEAARR